MLSFSEFFKIWIGAIFGINFGSLIPAFILMKFSLLMVATAHPHEFSYVGISSGSMRLMPS